MDKEPEDRQPAVAGQFYSGDSLGLSREVAGLFQKAKPKMSENVIAIISPHAGYVYSGDVAASAFNQIDTDRQYKAVFILASSHRISFDGASVYAKGNFVMPMGTVEVDIPLAEKIQKSSPLFSYSESAHLNEHSLETQLPFLQYKLGNNFKIVPIIIGTHKKETCEKLAEKLQPYLNDDYLFVISTDFSHYPAMEEANKVDKSTAFAITLNDPDSLLYTLQENEQEGIPNLHTSLCGWTSVLTLLYMTQNNPDIIFTPVHYKNSGEVSGAKDRVVGYHAISVSQKQQQEKASFNLTGKDEKNLLDVANKTLDSYIKNGKMPDIETKGFSDNIKQPCGAFVSLYKEGYLRGCIGRFTSDKPLYKVVQDMTIASATQDYRFPRVTAEEIPKIKIEISVLTPMQKINSINEIELGRHGIYIKKGMNSGTFLPQVATETGWTLEEFLGHCARDKARIGWEGWKDADIYIYEALIFGEEGLIKQK